MCDRKSAVIMGCESIFSNNVDIAKQPAELPAGCFAFFSIF